MEMQGRSFAPVGRALLFFGVMGIAVSAMTFGAGFQRPSDMSSTTVAALKAQERSIAAERFARAHPPAPAQAVQQASAPAGAAAIR
jgi:hypothetical protein